MSENRDRLAYIVGNDSYQELNRLEGAINDANLMEETLKSCEFNICKYINLNYEDFSEMVQKFNGKGYVDFIFYPERKTTDALILGQYTRSCNRTNQKKNYALRFMGKLGEKRRYTGRILSVGISYSKKQKSIPAR